MADLSLSMLGPLQIILDGRPATGFESRKVRALLAYLAAEADRPHPRAMLAGLLWPEFSDPAALSNLRYALSNLRKAIGDQRAKPHFLLISNEELQFNSASSYRLDVHDFVEGVESGDIERLKHAITLYRGEFLEGFTITDCAAFEEWVLVKREQIKRLMLATLRNVADYHEQCGEYEQVRQCAWRQVDLEPWQEEGHQQLMRALALGGQRGAALAQYETCCRLLADELGVQPSAETTALYEHIRDGTLVSPAIPPKPPAFLDPNTQATEIERQLFVARDAELTQLDSFLRHTLAGQGQVVFVIGEPGSGKTMLMREFTQRALTAHPDLVVVNGNCNAFSGVGDPYLPFLEMLDMLAGDVEVRWAGGAITREHAQRLWRLLPDVVEALVGNGPELVDRFVSGSALLRRAQSGARSHLAPLEALLKRRAAAVGGDSEQQTDLFEQFTKVLHSLAQHHPLLLIADDLQWADAGSISLLFHLGRRLAGRQILLVGAYRPEEVAAGRDGGRHPLEPVINELQHDFGGNQVDLSQAEVRRWIDALLDSEPNLLGEGFRETLNRHTGGHPLFTVELLRGLQARGNLAKDKTGRWVEGPTLDWETLPPRVEAVIAESVGRLPEALQTTLAVASVEGEIFTAQAVAHVLGTDEQEIIHRLSWPLSKQQRMVTPAGVQRLDRRLISHYRFRHFLFQKYLYNRLDEVERVHLHEAMGSALEALYGEQSPDMAAQLARHFEIAGLVGDAVRYLHMAGDRACHLSANAEAVAHYEHAIDLLNTQPDTPERANEELRLRVALGAPLLALYGYTTPEIEANYGRARSLTRDMAPSPELFWVLFGIQSYYLLRLMLPDADGVTAELLALGERLEDDLLMLVACQTRSLTALYGGDFETYQRYAGRVARLYDPARHRSMAYVAGVDIEVARHSHAAWAYWMMGYPDQAQQHAATARAWADELNHPFSLCMAYGLSSQMYFFQRDFTRSRLPWGIALEVAEKHHLAFWSTVDRGMGGKLLIEEGQLEEGTARLEQADATLKAIGEKLAYIIQTPNLAEAYALLGRKADGLTVLEEALRFAHSVGYRMTVPHLYCCKGDLLLADGEENVAEAEACFQHAMNVARQIGAKSWELRATLKLSRLWQRQGKSDAACQLLSSVYGWFTEGFDTPDLREARLLLDELTVH